MLSERGGYATPFVYNTSNDRWSSLPALPYIHYSLVTITDYKQLLAIGGMVGKHGGAKVSNEVFVWDEINKKWITPYPNMPTARYRSSSVSHKSAVIVASGMTCQNPKTLTRVVEVLHIDHAESYWSVVEQLPHIMREAIPLIVKDKLYFAQGYDGEDKTCNVIYSSIPELLQSSNKNTCVIQVWKKLPDMPYSSYSINHYQGRLITFSGGHKVEQPGEHEPVWQSVPMIHIYNPDTMTWDCVGEIPYRYLLGKSIHTKENNIFFVGGLIGEQSLRNNNDMLATCFNLLLSHHGN